MHDWQIDNGFFNRPIKGRTHSNTGTQVEDKNKDSGTVSQTGITRGFVSSVVQDNATAHERERAPRKN